MTYAPSIVQPVRTSRSFISQLYLISRPYSTAYGMLLGIAALLTTRVSPEPYVIGKALLITFCFPLSMVACHDSFHREADARAGREREYHPWLLRGIAIGTIAVALVIAMSAGWATLAWLTVSIVCGLGYGLLKSLPLLANIARGCTSAMLFLAVGSMALLSTTTLLIAGVVGLLDATGNIWGDVRDQQVDRRAGVTTIAVIAPQVTLGVVMLLHVSAIGLLTLIHPLWLLGLPLGLLPCLVCPHWRHRLYLLVKYGIVGAMTLCFVPTGVVAGVALCLIACGLPSFYSYGRIHQPKDGEGGSCERTPGS